MKETLTLDAFWEAWPLLGDSVLAGTIAGAALGLLGVYVVLRRLVFLSAAISATAASLAPHEEACPQIGAGTWRLLIESPNRETARR